MPGLSADSFVLSDLTTAEVEASERVHGALADDLRRLVDVAIRTNIGEDDVTRVRELVQQATSLLEQDASHDPAGLKFNHDGRSWNWGNTVVGVRNAMAPPVVLQWDDDGAVRSRVTLGAAYEGPPGCVHGGVSALILDHLMGETASAGHTRLTVTGTLTLRYLTPLPLGDVHVEARIAKEEGRKVTVVGRIGPGEPGSEPAIEAEGLFIIPRWASDESLPSDVGSLD